MAQFRASALLFFFNFKSETTSAIDRQDFYQIVKNKSIGDRNVTDSTLPCSSMKSSLHVGTSAAAVKLSPASQE